MGDLLQIIDDAGDNIKFNFPQASSLTRNYIY